MIELFLVRQNEMIEMPTESLTWSGQRYKAARKIEARVRYKSIQEGDTVLFKWKGKELFRGTVFNRQRKKDSMMAIRAYDMMQYLLLNSDVYIFTNQRADQIITRFCRDFEVPLGNIANTGYVIKSLALTNETALYDIGLKSIVETDKQSKRRFRWYSDKGKVHLQPLTQKDMWVLETGVNIEDFNLFTSIEDSATQVKMVAGDEDNPQSVVVTDQAGKQRFGVLQRFERVSGDVNNAQLKERANNLLSKVKGVQSELDIQSLGIAEVTSGQAVVVNIEGEIKNKTYYVDTDTHVFIGNHHTMNLYVVEENDLPEVNV